MPKNTEIVLNGWIELLLLYTVSCSNMKVFMTLKGLEENRRCNCIQKASSISVYLTGRINVQER